GGGALNGVSCTSLSACTAVGGRADGTTLAERWNGTRWRIQATPNPPGGAFLNSVSCASASACTAGGNTNSGKTLADPWNGTRWTIQPTPNPAGGAPFITLQAVACTSPSACMAVGGTADSSGNAVGTLAERWNGKSWQIVPTPKLTGPGSFLGGVALTSSTACPAGGRPRPVTNPRGTVGRHPMAGPGHPQPARRAEHLPHQRVLPHIYHLHRIRAELDRRGTVHPGRTVERTRLAHPAHPRHPDLRHRNPRRGLP